MLELKGGRRPTILGTDYKSTIQRNLVHLLISSKEVDSEEALFCDSLTINRILDLILFPHFFLVENIMGKIYYVIVISASLLSHLYSLQSP